MCAHGQNEYEPCAICDNDPFRIRMTMPPKHTMFVPLPACHRTDDDCAAVSWARDRKMLTLHLNCYGGSTYRCGLRNPPGGSVEVASFEIGWKWLCSNDKTELPKSES